MVTDVVAIAGNNEVRLTWQAPQNVDEADVTAYYVTVELDGRVLRVDADRTSVAVTGLKNGVESTFVVYAASERGRSKASEAVTATPTTGMEGEVAGLIVKFETSVSDDQEAVPGEGRVAAVDLTVASEIADGVHAVELSEAVTKAEADSIADALEQDPNVVWAEPDQFLFVSSNDESGAPAVPDDPDYQAKQWNLWDEFGIGLGDGARTMTGAFSPTAGAGVTVAVIDTGITAHPDLDGQLVPGYDFVSDPADLAAPRSDGEAPTSFDADGDPGRDADPTDPGDWRGVAPARDSTWHGTHIAGIIAAKANNAEGITGIAPGAKIQPIRALSWRGGMLSDIIASITWASGGALEGVPENTSPAKVINMSFAAQATCSVAMQDAITAATKRGTTLVAAAGNANDDASKYTPGNCNDVITVAATGRDGKRAPYSNYGAAVSISAPGGSLSSDGGVVSTSNAGRTSQGNSTYRAGEGTSIAAAHVSAVAASLYSSDPAASRQHIRTRLGAVASLKALYDAHCGTEPKEPCGSDVLILAQPAANQGVTFNNPVGSWPAGCTPVGTGMSYTTLVVGSVISLPSMPASCTTHKLMGWHTAGVTTAANRVGGPGDPFTVVAHPNGYTYRLYPDVKALRTTYWQYGVTPLDRTSTKALAGEQVSLEPIREYPNMEWAYWGRIYGTQVVATFPVGSTYTQVDAAATTLQAMYTIRILYDVNGGTGGPANPGAAVVAKGNLAYVNLDPTPPTRAGYEFKGWKDPDGWWRCTPSDVTTGNCGFMSIWENVTLTAQWQAVQYQVIFDAQDGLPPSAGPTWGWGVPIAHPVAPTRAGYSFAGWSTDPSGSVVTFPYTPSSYADVTLYAQWQEVLIPPAPGPDPAPEPVNPTTPTIPDLPPPARVEVEVPAINPMATVRPAVVVVDGAVAPIVVTRDDVEVGLDVVGEDFSLAIATSDAEKVRVAPTSRDSLVAPVQGWVDVQATGYAERSSVSVFLIPKLAARMSARANDDPYYLGQAVVGEDARLIGEFRLPDWASAGEYTLQINGYTPTGSVRSINVDLDLIDVRQESIVAARACVFPESTVKLSDECRRGLRSLKALFPSDAPTVNIAITGVAYGQGSKAMNQSVARERADRIKAYLERLGVDAEVTVDVVLRKGLAPGLDVTPPPVVTSSNGKPASTVLLQAVWRVEVGPGSARSR